MRLPFSFDKNIELESQSIYQAIHKYIDHRVLQMRTIPDTVLGMMVVRQVSGAADGLWLYARLMLDEIERLPSAALIRRHLRNVPHGLTQLYTQMLQSKESWFTEIDLAFAQQIYIWYDVSEYMPAFLYTDYLSCETLSLVLQKVNFGQPVFDLVNLISNLCSPLLGVRGSRDDRSKASLHDYEITSIHHTADQYIKERENLPGASLPMVLRPRRLRHLHRGTTAAWYFTTCEAFKESLNRWRDNPYSTTYGSYYELAYALWDVLRLTCLPADLDAQEATEATNLLHELIIYLDPRSENCLWWVENAMIINYSRGFHHSSRMPSKDLQKFKL